MHVEFASIVYGICGIRLMHGDVRVPALCICPKLPNQLHSSSVIVHAGSHAHHLRSFSISTMCPFNQYPSKASGDMREAPLIHPLHSFAPQVH